MEENLEVWVRLLSEKYPQFKIRRAQRFSFRPTNRVYLGTIESAEEAINLAGIEDYSNIDNYYKLLALHELGHALCKHKTFTQDITRLKMEREAWEKAQELCDEFRINYSEEFIEAQLDSYRNWLHQRSRCRKCGLTGYQDKSGVYHCPRCEVFLSKNKDLG